MPVYRQINEINFEALTSRTFHPSPGAWEDQVLYFLLLDRFSDGHEQGFLTNAGEVVHSGTTPVFAPSDAENAVQTASEAEKWRAAGRRFVGGTLKGLQSKMGYLKRLGITVIRISPVLKQVHSQETYTGNGIQNFLDVEPRFGTPEAFREVVETAHTYGLYVILDIILNHAGDVFVYQSGQPNYHHRDMPHPVMGYRDQHGNPSLPFKPIDLTKRPDAWPDGAIWPADFQEPSTFSQKGAIREPATDSERIEGDVASLKNIHHGHGSGAGYHPAPALKALCEVYKFWMAYADLDGYRIDPAHLLDPGAIRYFTGVLKEFAAGIGKENFYLIGELTGERQQACETLERIGLDAASGIDGLPEKLASVVKGYRNPTDYFTLFRHSEAIGKGSHTWFRNRFMTGFDDSDPIGKRDRIARFCADPGANRHLTASVGLLATTLGIPCIYYGTEQGFDGQGDGHSIREAMFGGDFGAFRSRQRHFFREDQPTFQAIARILALRKQHLALRRGRQYLRPISGDGIHFGFPTLLGDPIRSVVSWSRLFNRQEIVCAINTDPDNEQTAWVTIDNELHRPGTHLTCLYSTLPAQMQSTTRVEVRNGRAILLTVPAGGFVIYA